MYKNVIREGGRKNCPPIDNYNDQGEHSAMICPTCGKIYKRRAWYTKHVQKHNGEEARQPSVSTSSDTADRVYPHTSQGEPLYDNYQESMTIRTRLSIPSLHNSTWEVHDQNLAALLEQAGPKQDLNSQVGILQETVYNYLSEYYPPQNSYTKRSRENAFKSKMRRKKRDLIKQLRKAKALGDNHLSHQLARALRSILKLIQRISLQIINNSRNFDQAKHEADFKKNPFEYSKSIFNTPSGKLLLTKEQIYDHYKMTYEVPKTGNTYKDPNTQKPDTPFIDFDNSPPSLEEIEVQVKKKTTKSAPGPDGIPYIVFKKCPSVRKYLLTLFEKIWSKKQIPTAFGKAIFVPIPKKPEVTQPEDTRPIALTNTISKIFFSLLQLRLTRFMIGNKYFRPNHQKGFLPGISGCLEHNTLLAESLKDARTHERQITVCWIDLENAFGSVKHELLAFALSWYNFPKSVVDIIASYYSKLKFVIATDTGYTNPLDYNLGLFQGCCLSPIAFNIVINILIDRLQSYEKKWGYRFKVNNKYTESVLAFADDLAILTRNPKQCQDLLIEVDEYCSWTGGLRTKPSKCHCLCLGRRDTKFTSYDPGLMIGGQSVATVTETMPFKFLGRKIDYRGRTPSLEQVVDNFLIDLNQVDQQPISNVKKVWIYDNYLTSRLTWPFLVYDMGKTLLTKLDAGVIKTLKLWLGLAHSADPSTLFRDHNSFGMKLKKPSELYKHLRVAKVQVLGKSRDDIIATLPKDKNVADLESRLQFHKRFMAGSQSSRVGLGSRKKEEDRDALKSFLKQDEDGNYRVHAMNLEMQNDWLTVGEYCIPITLKWRTLLYDWSPALVKFYLNAFQMTLPDQSNLARWGKATEKNCYTCGEAIGTARHLLAGCKTLLDRGCYSRRHDNVLQIIREAVSLSVARARKGLTTNARQITFIKEGSKAKKASNKPYSILSSAPDWTILMDTYEKHYKIPEDVAVTPYRPDIFLYSKTKKRIVLVELTVPWETNIPKDHSLKMNKYQDLTNELIRNGYVVNLYAVEVGARGIPAKSLYNLLKDLGLSRSTTNSIMERVSKTALLGSYQIWLGRERNAGSEGER